MSHSRTSVASIHVVTLVTYFGGRVDYDGLVLLALLLLLRFALCNQYVMFETCLTVTDIAH